MLWTKNFLKTGFGIFCLVFVPALFFCFFLDTNNTFAVSDLSVSYSNFSFTDRQSIFLDCDSNCLASYHYLKIEGTNLYSSPGLRFIFNNLTYNLTSPRFMPSGFPSSSVILSLPFDSNYSDNSLLFYCASSSCSNTYSYTYTLIDSLSNCPPVTPCPEIPENPYDDKLDKIIQAIYTCGAILLVLYFFYCIYRMIIKSTGGF